MWSSSSSALRTWPTPSKRATTGGAAARNADGKARTDSRIHSAAAAAGGQGADRPRHGAIGAPAAVIGRGARADRRDVSAGASARGLRALRERRQARQDRAPDVLLRSVTLR